MLPADSLQWLYQSVMRMREQRCFPPPPAVLNIDDGKMTAAADILLAGIPALRHRGPVLIENAPEFDLADSSRFRSARLQHRLARHPDRHWTCDTMTARV